MKHWAIPASLTLIFIILYTTWSMLCLYVEYIRSILVQEQLLFIVGYFLNYLITFCTVNSRLCYLHLSC